MLLVSCRDHFAPHWYYRGLGPGARNAVFHYDTRPQCYAPWNNNYTRVWDPNPPHTVIFMIHKTLPGLDSQPQPSYKARPDPPTCLWCDKSFKYSFIGCWLECCDTVFSDENAGELWAHFTLSTVMNKQIRDQGCHNIAISLLRSQTIETFRIYFWVGMKLSNLSVVLATSIIVDSNSTSEDISNYFPPTLVSQNDDKLGNLGLGPQSNKSGKIFAMELR